MGKYLVLLAAVTLLLCVLLFGPAAEAAEVREIDAHRLKVAQLDSHWVLYARRLFGCPDVGEIARDVCNPTLGRTDYTEFRKARELAKQVFELRD